jgi:hypothetical protein
MGSLARRLAVTVCALLALASVSAGEASAATITVCPSGCAFSQIAPAIAAASRGDTIQVAAGTYRGGFSIDKTLSLVGAGAAATIIQGGGPVITIGRFLASTEPTVTISGVTVRGGSTGSSPEGGVFAGVDGAIALGGGVHVVPRRGFKSGATVTISDSVIRGNRVSPTASVPSELICPGGNHCRFADAFGGGIANGGNLTLIRTTVSDNHAVGPLASDSDGGGIWSGFGGSLTLRHSIISGNAARASDPNGRFAEGGGIFTDFGETVTINDSRISRNTASLSSSVPFVLGGGETVDIAGANSGGIHMGDGGSLTISGTQINGNTVTVTDLNGEPEAFDSGLCDCGNSPMLLRDSSISDNQLTASVGSAADVFSCCGFAIGGTLEFDGPSTITDTRITGNTTTATSPTGEVIAAGAVLSFFADSPSLLSDSVISGNTVSASSTSGSATILGAGVMNAAFLELRDDHIRENTGTATAATGTAQGGGIWNGPFPGGPPVQLTLKDTTVTQNALSGSAGITLQGGGLYTALPVTLTGDTITGNTPDNCFGVSC